MLERAPPDPIEAFQEGKQQVGSDPLHLWPSELPHFAGRSRQTAGNSLAHLLLSLVAARPLLVRPVYWDKPALGEAN